MAFRLQVQAWLNVDNPLEYEVHETIERLKQERKFSKVFRDGIRLVADLEEGRVDMLQALYPWVFDAVAGALEEERQAKIGDIEEQLSRIEALMNSQENVYALTSNGGPNTMRVPKYDVPDLDDDDFEELQIKPDTTGNSTANFINSVAALTKA